MLKAIIIILVIVVAFLAWACLVINDDNNEDIHKYDEWLGCYDYYKSDDEDE